MGETEEENDIGMPAFSHEQMLSHEVLVPASNDRRSVHTHLRSQTIGNRNSTTHAS